VRNLSFFQKTCGRCSFVEISAPGSEVTHEAALLRKKGYCGLGRVTMSSRKSSSQRSSSCVSGYWSRLTVLPRSWRQTWWRTCRTAIFHRDRLFINGSWTLEQSKKYWFKCFKRSPRRSGSQGLSSPVFFHRYKLSHNFIWSHWSWMQWMRSSSEKYSIR
jgi:hypothetical protein